ncbi:MAG: hypothetical protein HY465_05130 [Deltaproteobacteria bacterium]|nr:hypothetical protein [Deltaproteobacteria bacterium]
MKKNWLTWLVVTVVTFVLFVGGLILAPLLMPRGPFQQLIIETVRASIPGEVQVPKVSFRLLPRPSFSISGFTLTPTNSFFDHSVTFSSDVSGNLNLIAFFKGEAAAIRSIRFMRGKMTFTKPTGEVITLENVRLDLFGVERLGTEGTRIKLTGTTPTPFELSGMVALDPVGQQLVLREGKASLAGMQTTVDATWDPKGAPPTYRLKLTTAELTREIFAGPTWLQWSGPVALDVTIEQTATEKTCVAQVDMSAATVSGGTLLVKGASYPLKANVDIGIEPDRFVVKNVTFAIDENTLELQGTLSRDELQTADLLMTAQGFSLEKLKLSFPFLAMVEVLDSGSFSLSITGPLAAGHEVERTMTGRLTASHAGAFGYSIDDLDVGFRIDPAQLTVDPLQGTLFGGKMAGTGTVSFETPPHYDFNISLDGFDVAKGTAWGMGLSGTGLLTSHITATGSDATTFTGSIINEGTFSAPNVTLAFLPLGAKLAENVLPEITTAVGSPPGESLAETLLADGTELKEVKVTYRLEGGALALSSVTFASPVLQVSLDARIAAEGTIEGSGLMMVMGKTKRSFFDRFPLAFEMKGTKEALTVSLDAVKLTANFTEVQKKATPPPAAAKPAQPKAAKKPVITAPPPQRTTPAPSAPPNPEQTDQIMKVIIGK